MSRQPYVRPVSPTTWYMRNGRYKRYMLREVTCLRGAGTVFFSRSRTFRCLCFMPFR
jgi:fumarate reductase subunit C